MKKALGILLIIGSIVGGLYVGGWLMFIQPVIETCKAFDNGTLTGTIVGITLLKCLFGSTVGGLIAWVGNIVGMLLISSDL